MIAVGLTGASRPGRLEAVSWVAALLLASSLAGAPPAQPPRPGTKDPRPRPARTDELQKGDRPVEMSAAGGLSVDLKRQVGIAKKDVYIRRDDIEVCCDEAEAHYAGNRIERVECRGRVVIVRPDGTRATADEAVFVAVADRVTLRGRAEVRAKDAHLTGERIVYDIGEDRLEVEGTKSRFRFEPGKAAAPPPPTRACPPAGAAR